MLLVPVTGLVTASNTNIKMLQKSVGPWVRGAMSPFKGDYSANIVIVKIQGVFLWFLHGEFQKKGLGFGVFNIGVS